MGQKLAARVCRAAKVPYGPSSRFRVEQFEQCMLEKFGPGWRVEATANEQLATARAAVARAESEKKLSEDTEKLLVAPQPREVRLEPSVLQGGPGEGAPGPTCHGG